VSRVSLKWFILIPVVVTGLFALVYAIILSNVGDFVLYDSLKDSNGVSSMVNPSVSVLRYSMIVLGVASVLSIGLWIYLNFSFPNDAGRKFHDKAFCDKFIRDDLMKRFSYYTEDFSEIGTSVESAQNFSAVAPDPEYVYYHLYRIKEQGGRSRFLLALMNMEFGKEFLIHYQHSETSSKNDILGVVAREAKMLIENREKIKVVVNQDFVSGRSQTQNIPIQDVEGDENPQKNIKNGGVKNVS
jgi:hypothetical protein